MATFVLAKDADPNVPHDLWARPMARARENQRTEIAEVLIEHGAEA